MDEMDEKHLRFAIELSKQAKQNGNEPFGAVLVSSNGDILLEAENTEITEEDLTGHAETNLVRRAYQEFHAEILTNATLYSSCEPCPMCSGAIFWAGIGRVVYGLSKEGLKALASEDTDHFNVGCREMLNKTDRNVVVDGPYLEDEASEPHR